MSLHSRVEIALTSIRKGVIPTLDCDGSTVDQISWYFNLKYVRKFPVLFVLLMLHRGSVIDGVFEMIGLVFLFAPSHP